jgi:hypothetical protein
MLRTLSRWFWRIVLQVFPRRLDPLICPACHSERLMSRATFTSKPAECGDGVPAALPVLAHRDYAIFCCFCNLNATE